MRTCPKHKKRGEGANLKVDTVVVGAGVVGLAIARELSQSGRETIILEAEDRFGAHTSSRNSGVIHAGIYYPPASLKAKLCLEGRERLYDYASHHHVPFRKCGKLLVATTQGEIPKLNVIADNAVACGVPDLIEISPDDVYDLEPEVRCVAAYLSPSTGIIDAHAFMLALAGDIDNAGGTIVYKTPVERWSIGEGRVLIETGGLDPVGLKARNVINCAGHGAPRLLRKLGDYPLSHACPQYFAKGSYFSLQGNSPFKRLIYPIPGPASLGIHATLDLAGRVRFGPDIEWVTDDRQLDVDPSRALIFESAIRRYWPGLPDGALVSDYAGVRPKIHNHIQPISDFRIEGPMDHGVTGVFNLLGIESPGLTAAMAIAVHIKKLIEMNN